MVNKPEGDFPRVLAPEIYGLAEVYLRSLDCPRALTVWILIQHREYLQVASLKADPNAYAVADEYQLAAAASDFLRKYPLLPVAVDKEAETKKAWYQSEEECRRQNLKALVGFDPETQLIIDVAAEFTADLLGPCPLDLSPRFGPGATMSDPREYTTVLDKVTSRPTITDNARVLLPLWGGTAWERSHVGRDGYNRLWKQRKRLKTAPSSEAEIVKGGKFFTVPKTALVKRGCICGASFNLSYQLAVGTEIRKALLHKYAYDLTTRQEHHRELAREGSILNDLATIDSERASDTQSYSTNSMILSKSGLWGDLLKALREPYTLIDDKWVALEKFSSMGCGYTFELETVVFLSLCYAVAWSHSLAGSYPGRFAGLDAEGLIRAGFITVYGDDVIVPSFMARDVAAVFKLLGFTINLKKSYFEGEFRESCGGDYFRGKDVSTFKLSEEVLCPADWFSVHNGLKGRFVDPFENKKNGKAVLNYIKSQLPKDYRKLYGPTFLGDRVLHGEYDHLLIVKPKAIKDYTSDQGNPSWPFVADPNQLVASLRCLEPSLTKAQLEQYSPNAQLAYVLYTMRVEPPTRRPIRKVKYDISYYENDFHVMSRDYVPKAPKWIAESPYAPLFGILPNGSYVG